MAESEHVVLFPFIAQGHIIPFLKLAKLLVSQGLTVSFLTTTKNASKLQSQALGSHIRFIPLSLPHIDGLPHGCDTADSLTLLENMLLLSSAHKLSAPFEEWLQQVTSDPSQKPLCIISDVFLGWTADSASRFGIPRVVFHTTGAMGASILQYLFTNPLSELISGDGGTVKIRDLSLVLNLSHSAVVEIFGNNSDSPDLLRMLETFRHNYGTAKRSCAATLVNTLDGVDAEYVRYLEETSGKPAWPIALPLRNPQKGVQNESECIRWLDTQEQNSVLFVSFGSQLFLSEGQIKALARGIEASEQPFIWSIKDPVGSNINSCEFLPEGFVEATKDRGMVVHGWVPQQAILFHPSTACFMSHCGWNSTLESVCAGVSMVVWPMIFDQFINAKLVVEQLRIGLQICEGWDKIPNSYIIEKTIKAAMIEEMGKEMHERAGKIKESIEDMSWNSNVETFVSYIVSLRSHQILN
ncbi:hypothetical protein KI387_014419 [Taxus chinensis]|uniref:Glycosyltransferase n=1 Tax=Taxus chinensis TaxID=29808 RepID=A0AA38CNC2_TAXCH|nr:hypothetical protein KI387_014419 [Taxus chinensis]